MREPAQAMIDAFPLLDSQVLAVVDVETTGLSAAFGDRICEVGIVRAQGDTILDTFHSLVNPQRPLSPGAAQVNGLSDAELSLAPPFAEIAGQALERLEGGLLVCHNAPFDLSFLEAEFSRLGVIWQPVSVIDTLQIARRYFQFRSNSLSSLASQLGIDSPQAHRALGDALTTFQLLRRFYRQLTGQEGALEITWISQPPPPRRSPDELHLPPSLQEALEDNRPIRITYVDAQGEQTIRTITPLQALATRGAIYLVAYCHLRQAERNFRLDRIIAIE